jgi:hypothetical protein
MIRKPLFIDFSRAPQDLRTVAALAHEQMYDLRDVASDDRPEFAMLTGLHRFRLRVDDRESARLEFRSSLKQLAFTVDGSGACQTLTAFFDVAAYLALYYRTPDWQARLLTRYALMAIKVVAAKVGTLTDQPSVHRELAQLSQCDDQQVLLAALLTVAPPVLLRGLGGATAAVIDAHAVQLGVPRRLLNNLIEFGSGHVSELNSAELPDGWHQARLRCHGKGCDSVLKPYDSHAPKHMELQPHK